MGKAKKLMVEVRGDSGTWLPVWIGRGGGVKQALDTDERQRTKTGLKERQAQALVAELTRPVTGYERLATWSYRSLCAGIRGYGLAAEDVRIVPFRKGTWSKYGD